MQQSILLHFSFLLKIAAISTLVLLASCGEDPPANGDPCKTCVNGECIENVCVCDDFWTGVNCDSVLVPTKVVWKNLTALGVKAESALGPWDQAAGEEAPDLYFRIYDGFYFDKTEFANLTPIYESSVSTNWVGTDFIVQNVNLEFDWVSSGSITILLADKDGQTDDFVELGYIELEDYQDTELPYSKVEPVFGTLQFPINFNIDLEYLF